MSEHKKKVIAGGGASGIVIGDGKHHRRHYNLHLKFIGMTALVLALIGGGSFWLMHHSSPHAPDSSSKHTATTPTIYDKQYQSAKGGVSKAKTKTEQVSAYIQLAQSECALNKYKDAIQDFQKALTIAGTDKALERQAQTGLAYAYAYDGQNSKSVDTFNQLITLLQQQNASALTIQNYTTDRDRISQGKSL